MSYFAQSGYGEGSYSTSSYEACAEGDTSCQVLVDSGAQPGVPNTGLLTQPLFLIPLILGIAVLLVGIEYFVRRRIRKNRTTHSTTTESNEQQ